MNYKTFALIFFTIVAVSAHGGVNHGDEEPSSSNPITSKNGTNSTNKSNTTTTSDSMLVGQGGSLVWSSLMAGSLYLGVNQL